MATDPAHAVTGARDAAEHLAAAVRQLRDSYGDTLGVRRLVSDVGRFSADLDELGDPAPDAGKPSADDVVILDDTPYDESMWSGADTEGTGAPDRHTW